MLPEARRRPRAEFTTELPRRVPAIDQGDTSFDQLVYCLASSPSGRATAREELLLIARDYRFSRSLELTRTSRSDTAETLRAISRSGRSVVTGLDGLSSEATSALDIMMSGVAELDWEPGIQAIDTLAEVLQGLSEAGLDLMRGNSQLKLSDGDDTLEPLVAATRTAARQLSCFPDAAKWWLVVLQGRVKLEPTGDLSEGNVALIREACMDLSRLAGVAAEVSKADRGPRSSTAQMRAVHRMKELYETITGRKASHSQKAGRHYTGALKSEFGQFAEAAFFLMEPQDSLRRGLAEAVSYAVWESRSAGAEMKSARAGDDFERRTLRALAAWV